jgi:hypothetical protein
MYKDQATTQSERATALRTRAEVLISAGIKQREACFAANAVKSENHEANKIEAAAHNLARHEGIKHCKENRIFHTPSQPVSTCSKYVHVHEKAGGTYVYNALQAKNKAASLGVHIAELNSKIESTKNIIAVGVSSHLEAKYTKTLNELTKKRDDKHRHLDFQEAAWRKNEALGK